MGLARRIHSIIEFLEKDRIGIFYIFLIILVAGLVRGYIETVCTCMAYAAGLIESVCGYETGFVLKGTIVHDTMAALSGFLGGTLVLHLAIGEKVKKIWNASVLPFAIIFIMPPVFDMIFFGGCIGNWGHTTLETFAGSLYALPILPLFAMVTGFGPGLVAEIIIVTALSIVYVLIKTKSIKRIVLLMFFGSLMAYMESVLPLSHYLGTNIFLGLKLMPRAYEWYFYLALFWASILLVKKRQFLKDIFRGRGDKIMLTIPLLSVLGSLLVSLDMKWYLFDLPELFMRFVLSLFLVLSFIVFSKWPGGGMIKGLKGIFSGTGKAKGRIHLEFALFLQVLSLFLALVHEWVLFVLVVLMVLVVYTHAATRKFWLSKPVFSGCLAVLCFLMGYSIESNNLFANTSTLLWSVLFFAVFFGLVLFHARKSKPVK